MDRPERLADWTAVLGHLAAVGRRRARSFLLSWAVGVAFGRFDWRLATGEREAPPEPDPFDPLPAKSPGMLPDGAAPFHVHSGCTDWKICTSSLKPCRRKRAGGRPKKREG